MKLLKILIALVFVTLIAGLAYVSMVDIPIEQQEILKEIPASSFTSGE